MKRQVEFRISMKHWERLPWRLKQEILIHVPQVWVIWKPYIRWLPWLGGRWIPNNLSQS